MKIFKNLFLLLTIFTVGAASLFALDGALSGTKGGLKVIKTEYFDIIYPEECRSAAEQIAVVADGYYREIAKKLGYEPYQHFPVTLTKQVETPNAYFTMAPYNMIVYYDTDATDDLDMYENSVQSIFYHELTHAVTLNSKSAFWRGMSFFGDFFTPAGISLTSFWYEGATVSFESAGKGGRLNDPFFTQLVVQAKVLDLKGEKLFPSWRDVTGVRDTYPYGNDAYAFGACFSEYLQDTYGIEKFAEFWKRAGTWTSLSFCAGVFKKTYGKNISDVWNDFKDAVPVPDEIEDFSKSPALSFENSAAGSVDTIVSKDGIIHSVWCDSLSAGLFLDGKKVLSCTGIQSVRFLDENNVYVSRLVDRSNYKREDFVYEISSGKRRSCFKADNTISGSGWSASIVKNGLDWSIAVLFDGNSSDCRKTSYKYDFGLKIVHNLHLQSETDDLLSLCFVWADLKTGGLFGNDSSFEFSKIGKIEIDKKSGQAQVFLQNKNNFAGIIDAAACGKDNYYAVCQELYAKPVRQISVDWSAAEKKTIAAVSFDSSEKSGEKWINVPFVDEKYADSKNVEREKNITFDSLPALSYGKYNPSKYFFRGARLPVGLVECQNHDFETTSVGVLGATFVSSTNWTSCISMVSAGWSPSSKAGGVAVSLNPGDDDTSLALSGNIIFDSKGFLQANGQGTFSQVIAQGKISTLSLGFTGGILDGEEDKASGTDYVEGLSTRETAWLYFTNIHHSKPGYLQYSGFYFKPFVMSQYDDLKKKDSAVILKDHKLDFNCGASAGLRLPFVLPVHLTASIFPESEVFASAGLKLNLFDLELHKGIPAVSLYMQRLTIDFSASGKAEYSSEKSWDIVRTSSIARNLNSSDVSGTFTLSCELTLAPNTSYFTSSSYNFGIGELVSYKIKGNGTGSVLYGLYTNVAW